MREAALVIFLGVLGIPGETALAASLYIGLSQILVGLPGAAAAVERWLLAELEREAAMAARDNRVTYILMVILLTGAGRI